MQAATLTLASRLNAKARGANTCKLGANGYDNESRVHKTKGNLQKSFVTIFPEKGLRTKKKKRERLALVCGQEFVRFNTRLVEGTIYPHINLFGIMECLFAR